MKFFFGDNRPRKSSIVPIHLKTIRSMMIDINQSNIHYYQVLLIFQKEDLLLYDNINEIYALGSDDVSQIGIETKDETLSN